MRTIRLTEHKAATETLSAEELSELSSLPLGLVEISPYGVKDRFTIKARSRVGTIALPSIRVLIRPKVASRNVFFLLAYTNRIRWRPDGWPSSVRSHGVPDAGYQLSVATRITARTRRSTAS
jgi:hypothetical protein